MNRVGRNYKWKGPHIYYASITSHLKYEGQKYISVYSCFKKEKERKKKHIFKTNFWDLKKVKITLRTMLNYVATKFQQTRSQSLIIGC